jgi:PAS domain S-box-containing protein
VSDSPKRPEHQATVPPVGDRFRLLVEGVRDYAIFMLDPQGRVQTWNSGARLIKGYEAGEIIGQHFSRFYPPESLAKDFPAHELRVAAAEGRFEDEGWRLRKDGSRFWANVVITAIFDERNQLLGFAKVTRDLTHRREYEESMRQSEERFRLLVEGVSDYAIFMLNTDGTVATWNAGAARIKGYSSEEIVGQHFSKFYPEDAIESGWPEHELRVAAAEGRFVDEGWRLRKDGSRFWAHVTITALRDEEHRLRGFAKLTRDLTERKRTEALEASGAARAELLEAERGARMLAQRSARMKDEFLATLSHELRTPLNAILGWAQLLRARAPAPEELQRGMEIIDRNARAQVRLIDDLLDLSRIMSGRFRLDVRQISLAEIIKGALDSIEPAAQNKGVRLESILDPKSVIVSGDAGRLQQVFWNLLSNAIKFTPKGGKVQVLLQRVNSHIELSVSDTGIGIPATFLPHVFERFSQKDGSTHRKYGGLGLGLAISKQLVDLHGGSIQAKSLGEGKGATFVVMLPLVLLGDDKAAPHRVHPTAADTSEPDTAPVPRLDGLRALVVEDEADALELIQRVLEDQGASVATARSGEEALRWLATSEPDILISDIGMPGMDGYQFMRLMRAAEPKDRRTPALALTAFARPDDRKHAILAGYQAHLAKPFDVAELAIVVAGLAGRT